jgi:Kdo2-lipid IVA lauroyltransferase/acyltransferase
MGLGLLRALSWLPLPLLSGIGAAFGMALYFLHGPRRRVVRINIERCFPSLSRAEQGRVVRRHFRAFGQSLTDIPIAWWAGPRRLRRLVRYRDRHYFDEALAAGQSVILLAPHFLGLEIGGVRLSLDAPLVTVFRHPDNRLVRAVMQRARARFGARLIEHNRLFTSMVRAIKSGTPLYYLPDQDAGRRHSVFAPFFGVPAATFTALSRLAEMTNAVVIPCITYRRRWGRGYETVFRPPLTDFPSGDPLADTTRMNAEIERAVQAHPEQYFWLHKRFKTRPAGDPKFY